MTKQLLLVRHAKADRGHEMLKDFERPLNERGHENAAAMAAQITTKNYIPDLIISSPALRAISTAKYFAYAWQIPVEQIEFDPTVYEANVPALLALINRCKDQYNRIAIFGHNPGLTDLINYLADPGIYHLPTCATALLNIQNDRWAEVSEYTGQIQFVYSPGNLDSA